MADLSLAQGRCRSEDGAVSFLVRLLGFVSGRRRLLQLRRRRFLSPRGRGYLSSDVVVFTVLACLGGWRSRKRVIEARPRLKVLFSPEWKAFAVVMCGEWFPVFSGESSVGLPGDVSKGGDVGAAAFVRVAAKLLRGHRGS
ncbi:hypothetical protein YC2023_055078 [Brassica napus]